MPESGNAQSLKHVLRIIAAGAVRRQPKPHALLEHVVEAHAPASKLAVAGRSVHYKHAACSAGLDVLVGAPHAWRHEKAIRQDADLVEMTDRADTEKNLALQKLAFRLADVHMHHGIEVDRRLLAAPELLLSTAVRSRGTDDRQDQVGAAAYGSREFHEIFQRLRTLESRDPLDLLARSRGRVFCINADRSLILAIREGERQPSPHSGISHRGDGVQSAPVRPRRSHVEGIHHARAAGSDHLDDPELRADVDRFVRILAPPRSNVLPPYLEREPRPCTLEQIRG